MFGRISKSLEFCFSDILKCEFSFFSVCKTDQIILFFSEF